jgi:cystathionine beta-lyase
MGMDFDRLDPDEIRSRGGAKWSVIPDDVLPAWVADMDFPVAEPIQQAIAEAARRSAFGYALPSDRHELVPAFCDRVAERFSWTVVPGRVALLTDIVQGLYLGSELFSEPGDGVAIQTPIYPRFLDAVNKTGRRVVANPLVWSGERYEVDLDGLRDVIDDRTRILMLCHPHNPTGRVYGRDELEALAEIAIERDLIVLSDEIHADLLYDDRTHIPFASLSPVIAERTLTLMSASKAFNVAGLHCGLVIFGGDAVQERFEQFPARARGMVGALGMAGSLAAFREGQPWLDAVKAQLHENRALLTAFLAEHMPQVRYAEPEATYLAWLDCRGLELGMEPHRFFFHEARVALSPGPEFGPEGEGFVRLNIATSRPILQQILERMASALTRRRRELRSVQMTSTETRSDIENSIKTLLSEVREIDNGKEIDRDSLAEIQDRLVKLTARKDLFGPEQFPEPAADKPAVIYLLSEDDDHRYAMYLVCAAAGGGAPPHDHTTWAVIAGLDGEEENRIWERTDDGSTPGKGELKEVRQVVLRDGDGIAFMPDDIHSIKAISAGPTRHFHLYGKSFDEQTERVGYNLAEGTYATIPTGMLPVDESRRIA